MWRNCLFEPLILVIPLTTRYTFMQEMVQYLYKRFHFEHLRQRHFLYHKICTFYEKVYLVYLFCPFDGGPIWSFFFRVMVVFF